MFTQAFVFERVQQEVDTTATSRFAITPESEPFTELPLARFRAGGWTNTLLEAKPIRGVGLTTDAANVQQQVGTLIDDIE